MPHYPTQMDPVEGSRETVDRELERQETDAPHNESRPTTVVTRSAEANWQGGLRNGKGSVTFANGALHQSYSFASRFEDAGGTNPEELVAAAHAGCFSMALAAGLEHAGYSPKEIRTRAKVSLDKKDEGFEIGEIALKTEVAVDGIETATLHEEVEKASRNCPISRALAGTKITVEARQL